MTLLSQVNPQKENIMLMDLNECTGNKGTKNVTGIYSEDIINDNGERSVNLCESYLLKFLNCFIVHKYIHKNTWYQTTRNISSIMDCFIQRQSSNSNTIYVRICQGHPIMMPNNKG